MKFLADESVDLPVFDFLKEAGFDIQHISFIRPGSTDVEVLSMAYSNKSVLITVDKDFGELAFRNRKPSNGIILYRLSGLKNIHKAQIVLKVISNKEKQIKNNFVVITEKQVRIKRLLI